MSERALVTGWPRQLARAVASELLERGASVTLLVRPRHLSDARTWARAKGERAEVIEGDVASIDLGLAGAEYLWLVGRVDVVHHAAYVTWEGPDEGAVADVNVTGTREVIEFARSAKERGRAPRVVAWTSVLCSGDFRGTFREQDLELGQKFRSVVEATLFRAEGALRKAMAHVPVTVLRAGLLVGDSRTGEVDRLDGVYAALRFFLQAPGDFTPPVFTGRHNTLNLVPVDWAARAGLHLASRPESVGRTYHLVDPAPLPAERVLAMLARRAGRSAPYGRLPSAVARLAMMAPGVEKLAPGQRAFVYRLATAVRYADQGAREVLAPAGLDCPTFTSYVDAMVDHVRARVSSPPPPGAPEAKDEPDEHDPFG